jgi:signal transduction histidine kinase
VSGLSLSKTTEQYAGRMTRIGLTTFLVLLHVGLAFLVMIATDNFREWDSLLLMAVVGAGGALYGWLFSHGVLDDVQRVETALMQLAQGQTIAPLPTRGREPMRFMMEHVNALIERQAELTAMRQQLAEQIGGAAAQEERSRLARDLHDSIKQQIFSISVSAAGVQARWDSDPDGAKAALADVRKSAQEAMVEMRAMLQQLAPAPLEKVGLAQAVRDQCEALGYRSGAEVRCTMGELPPDAQFPPGAQEALFRIAQEALTNIARHARAAHVSLELSANADGITLHIDDDGQGFDTQASVQGMGLANMRARAAAIGGTLTLESQPAAGTRLRLYVPRVLPVPEDAPPPALVPQVEEAFQQAKGQLGLLAAALFISSAMGLVALLGVGDTDASLVSRVLTVVFAVLSVVGFVYVGRVGRKTARMTWLVMRETGKDSPQSLLLRYHIWLGIMMVPLFTFIFVPVLLVESAGSMSAIVVGGLALAGASAAFLRAFGFYRGYCQMLTPTGLRAAARDNFVESTWGRYGWAWSIPLLMNLLIDFPPQFPPLDGGDWLDVSLPMTGVVFLMMNLAYWRYHRGLRQQVAAMGDGQ